MRILFINSEDTNGGAAVVARRLMNGLARYHATENLLLVKTKTAAAEAVPGAAGIEGIPAATGDHIRQILTARWQLLSEKIIDRLTRPVGLLYQSFPFSSHNLLKMTRSFRPDIINLHNTHSGYFATPLIRDLSRLAPLVWTLHDMWSFTGNAVHTFGNESWKYLRNDRILTKIPPRIGLNTGAWLLRQKKRIYGQADLTVVTPSLWLRGLARQSPVFEGKNIYQVFNGIEPSVFRPQDKQAAKIKLGLPPDRKTILFSSHFLTVNNPWKGGADLLEILRRLNALATEKISFLALGEGRLSEESFGNVDVRYMGYVSSETTMADCLSAADIFIYPTRADNLPNVLVESIACGTPAVSFDIGGCGEIITHNYNGLLIRPFDHEAFAAGVRALLEDGDKRVTFGINGLTRAKENFELDSMAGQYYTIFQKILGNNKNPRRQ